MYEYNAIVDRVVDGDTIDCTIAMGSWLGNNYKRIINVIINY